MWYGDNVADDGELRLCGDLAGKRVLELGIASTSNAITMAAGGAKTIAVDPSADKIARLRAAAEVAEVKVECHHGERPRSKGRQLRSDGVEDLSPSHVLRYS